MPRYRDKVTGEIIYVPDAPQAIPIGMQDPTRDLERPKAQADINRINAGIQNDAERLALARMAAERAVQAEARAGAAANRAAQVPNLTPGQKKADEAFGVDYAAWGPGGGSASVQKHLGMLQQQIGKLNDSDTISGPVIGRMWDAIRQGINPDTINVQDNVEAAIQASLRETLGAQFTEKEGARLLARSYNPTVQESENATRVQRTTDELRDKAWSKDDAGRHFAREGTLAGYKPTPRPRNSGQALSYGEQQLAAEIARRGLAGPQAQAARDKFYEDPRVSRLRTPPKAPPRKQNRVIDWNDY